MDRRRHNGATWPGRREQRKRYVLQDRGLPGREAHAGRDRRGAGRRSSGRTSARDVCGSTRGRGQQPSCAGRDRAPARRSTSPDSGRRSRCAGSRRHGVSAQGLGRAADDPVRRDAIYAADRNADRASRAVRAVGAANGRNPVSIIAPCHRVIGTTGRLTGFAGGLDAKARLLALEGTKPMTLLDVSDGAGGGLVVAGNQARRNRQAIPRVDRRDRQRQIRELPVVEVRADVGVDRV